MPPQPDKSNYTTHDMIEAAKRLRSTGFSTRTGKKLKRRSVQPVHEQRRVLRVLVLVVIFLAALVAGFASWWLTTHQAESRPDSAQPPRHTVPRR